MIDTEIRVALLRLARYALTARVNGAPAPAAPDGVGVAAAGLFVTLRRGGRLRGCLGTVEPCDPLTRALVRLAGDVAEHDYRFAPVTPVELDELIIDLSILTPPEAVAHPGELVTGVHGVIVRARGRQGLLLPQVATEQGWDAARLVAETCRKAGLPRDAWRQGALLLRFEAEVFGEAASPGSPR